jgi:Spy/CpxP family protein refolding chaperone
MSKPEELEHGTKVAALFIVALAVSCFLLVSPTALSDLSAWAKDHGHLTGWFQALGTMVAISIAIYVPYRQRQQMEKTRQEERRQYTAAFSVLLEAKITGLHLAVQDRIHSVQQKLQRGDEEFALRVSKSSDRAVKFIEENWEHLAKMDKSTADPILRAYRALRSSGAGLQMDFVTAVEGDDDDDRHDLRFDRQGGAIYLAHFRQAEEALTEAIDQLEIVHSGEPGLWVTIDLGDSKN